jgi:hypothetical protein
LRLAPKIGLSIALFLLPITLILVLLAGVQNKHITFASMKVAGTRALAVVGNLQAGVDHALQSGEACTPQGSGDLARPDFATLSRNQEAVALAQARHPRLAVWKRTQAWMPGLRLA